MKKILGGILAVAIILTGIFGNINIVRAANSSDVAVLDDDEVCWFVEKPNEEKQINIIDYNPEQEITIAIFTTPMEELEEDQTQNFKCKIESVNTDVVDIIGEDTFEWTIGKDSFHDGWSYVVFATINIQVHKSGKFFLKVTDLNNNLSYTETNGLNVASPGFSSEELNISDDQAVSLETWDKNILSSINSYSFVSLNPNIAAVSQNKNVLTVTPVANGTTYIIGGNDAIGFMVCKVNVSGMGYDAADLEYQDYASSQGDENGASHFYVKGYDIETRGSLKLSNGSVNDTTFKGVFLNRFKDKVDADNMRFSISREQVRDNTPLESMKELVEAEGKTEDNAIGLYIDDNEVCYGLRTTAFPYIKIYKKNQSVRNGGIYEKLDSFMCGNEVASFSLGNMDYDEESGEIYIKEGTLQDGEDYVLVIEPEFSMYKWFKTDAFRSSFSANYGLYFDFTTMSGKDLFPARVAKLAETEFSYTPEYASLLKKVADTYNSMSAADKQDSAIQESYAVYTGYQKVYDLFTAVQKLGSSAVTADSIKEIQVAVQAYNELTGESSPYKDLITPELQAQLDQQMKTVETVKTKYRVQTITVQQDKFTLSYSPNATVTIKASSDRNGTLSYVSSNTGVAAVDNKGVVTVKGVGTATITVKAAGTADFDAASKTVTVTVNKGTQTITVKPGSIASTFKLNASVVSGDGKLTYSSDKTSIATVDANGKVTVKNAGTVRFTIKAAESALYKAATKTVTMDITAVKGKTYTVGNLKYKVTNAKTNGNGTVTVTGVKTKKATTTIGKTVKIGNHTYKITAVGASAFKNNKKLTTVTVGANVKTIGANAFYGCTKLKKATLGKGVTSIGSKAFYGDKKLAKIVINSSSLKTIGSKALKGIKSTAVIDVPNKKVSAYKRLMKGKGQSSKVKIK